jgi:uncharacterized protein YjdB
VKFTINKVDQNITGFLPTNMSVGHRTEIHFTAISSSGLEVSYESNNPTVARIEDNLIMMVVGAGTAVITANQAGNHNYNPAPALTCTLTVNLVSATDVSLNKNEVELSVGGSDTLIATVSPPNAPNRDVTWTSRGSGNAVTIEILNDTCIITGASAGMAVISVKIANGNEDDCWVTVTGATGISTVDESSFVTVRFYNKILYIDSPAAEQIEVYTLSGKLLHRASKPAGKASFTIPNSEQILIVRGSSGWTKKIEDK